MTDDSFTRLANKAAHDFAAFQRDANTAHERNKDQPVGDAYRMTFVPPPTWGAATERIEATYNGLPAVHLRFANRDQPIWQLQVPVRGFDN